MPDVSIAVSARNNFSREFERMSRDAGAFNKDVEELNREITALNKKKATLKTDLDGAKKELREVQKGLDGTAESIERLENAHLNVDNITDELREVSQAARQAQKDLTNADSQISKSRSGGGAQSTAAGESQSILDRLAGAGALSMVGDLAGELAGTYISSAYGSQAGSMFSSVLGGAGSGAAIGSMIAPGIGTAIGAGVGALVGAVSGANSIYQERDDAFKSYVQEQVEGQLSKQEEMRASGSTIAGKRETDLISFTTLFDKNKELAERYLKDVRNLSNTTPFLYDDLTSMSKVLKTYGFQVGNMIPTLTKIGDAGAALGMETQDMNAIATALGRMYMGGNATREDLDIMNDRGINAVQYLADAYGVDYGKMLEKISGGEVLGKRAVEIILEGMEKSFKGAMADQSTTFEGLTSTLEGWNQEIEAAMGEGYNEGRKVGMKNQIAFYSGEAGQKMQEVYAQMGTLQADLENMQEEMYRNIISGVLDGTIAEGMDEDIAAQVQAMHDRYTEAMATLDSDTSSDEEKITARAELGALMGEAQAMAESEYYNSEAVTILTDANVNMASNIAAGAGDAYRNAGYALGQELTKGIASVVANYRPTVSGPYVDSHGNIVDTIEPAAGHAFGLNRVPYDNYPAMLHEGERVLTANQARQADAGGGLGGGINIQLYGMTVREDADVTRIAREMVIELKIAMAARKG